MSRRLDDDWAESEPVVVKTYRDQKTKEAFIKYLQLQTDERFFQAVANFSGFGYLGAAGTPDGKNFRDLYHFEADENFNFGDEDAES